MIWTLALVSTGIGGLWLMAKHWYGWLLYTLNEVLWFLYALSTHDLPLTLMAVMWFWLGLRGLVVAHRQARERAQVQAIAKAPVPWTRRGLEPFSIDKDIVPREGYDYPTTLRPTCEGAEDRGQR